MKKDGHAFAAPVGSYAPNAFGVCDMHGNVSEWCADNVLLRSSEKAYRGGSWHDRPFKSRSSKWTLDKADGFDCDCGFRIVEAAPLVPEMALPQATRVQDRLSEDCRRYRGRWLRDPERAVNDGADINGLDSDGFTGLYWAAVYAKDPFLVRYLIEDLGADPNVAVAGGLNSIDVLGQWLWGRRAGKPKLTPAMRRCPRSIPFGMLEEDVFSDVDEDERASSQKELERMRPGIEWIVWTLIKAGAKPTVEFPAGNFEELCGQLEVVVHQHMLDKIDEDLGRQQANAEQAADLRAWIARRMAPRRPNKMQRIRDSQSYFGSGNRPGQLSRIVPVENSNALAIVFEVSEKEDEIKELEKPIRRAEGWVKLRYACGKDEARRRYNDLREAMEKQIEAASR